MQVDRFETHRHSADPIHIENRGVAAEFGTETKLRKNYVFYEGYSRLDCDLEVKEYGEDEIPGAGVMVRVSGNVAVYAASGDTVNVLQESFLDGSAGDQRRILIPATGTLLRRFPVLSEGVWIRAVTSESQDSTYYLGISSVRRPLSSSVIPDEAVPFRLTNETEYVGDIKGILVGGMSSNVLKVYELRQSGQAVDTIRNSKTTDLLLHGQRYRIAFDSSYFAGDSLSFELNASDADMGKMQIVEKSGLEATLQDTSVTEDLVSVLGTVWNAISDAAGDIQTIATQRFSTQDLSSRRIILLDAVDSKLSLTVGAETLVPIAVETNPENWLPEKARSNGILVRWSEGVRVYTSETPNLDNQIVPPNFVPDTYDPIEPLLSRWFGWEEFEDQFLGRGILYVAATHKSEPHYISFGRVVDRGTDGPIVDEEERLELQTFQFSVDFDLVHSGDPVNQFSCTMVREDGGLGFYRVLGGMALKLKAPSIPGMKVTGYRWATGPDGMFFADDNGRRGDSLGTRVEDDAPGTLWWQGAYRHDLAEGCTLYIRVGDEEVIASTTFKSRILELKSYKMTGSDVRMLKCVLRILGHSDEIKTGPRGDIAINTTFDERASYAVFRFKKRDVNSKIAVDARTDAGFYGRLGRHCEDFFEAVAHHRTADVFDKKSIPNSWIEETAESLSVTIPQSRLVQITKDLDETFTLQDLANQWVKQETGNFGHWGYQRKPYRITTSSEKRRSIPQDITTYQSGSIGFVQILGVHKYGYPQVVGKAGFPDYNFYDPKENLLSKAAHQNHYDECHGCGGFYYALEKPAHATRGHRGEKSYKMKEGYPRIAEGLGSDSAYVDNWRDLFSKGIASYNAGVFLGPLRSKHHKMIWPELLRIGNCLNPSNSTYTWKWGIYYSVGITERLIGKNGLKKQAWAWEDIGQYNCRDKINTKVQRDTVFSFEYNELDYLEIRTWQSVRDAKLKAIQESFEDPKHPTKCKECP